MKRIGVHSCSGAGRHRILFERIAAAVEEVSFEERPFEDGGNIDAWVVLDADREFVARMGVSRRPCYVVMDKKELVVCGGSARVTFSRHASLSRVLQGREVTADEAVEVRALPRWLDSGTTLCAKEGASVWAIQEAGTLRHQFVSLVLPEVGVDVPLFRHFCGSEFLGLLPLWSFVRWLTEDGEWQDPPLRASFMFDDPNLHWATYGFVRFAETARHAGAHNYHVSFATIPLDSWFVHAPTAALFRKYRDRMSLVMHGNDHVANELARQVSSDSMNAILRQAISRIESMEERTGLEVGRIMVPPHGACSEETLAEMAGLQFEAACVSAGSLRHHNRKAPWSLSVGMRPFDMIAGLPVFPRFAFSRSCENSILVAALLGQPIVPMTHHQAVAEGYEGLDEMAGFVNSLGGVEWADMKTIARSQYARRQDGAVLRVKMRTRRITVRMPSGTNELSIERMRRAGMEEEQVGWRPAGGDGRWRRAADGSCIRVDPGGMVEVVASPERKGAGECRSDRSRRLVPVARRILTETRDRALPFISRISRSARSRRPTLQASG